MLGSRRQAHSQPAQVETGRGAQARRRGREAAAVLRTARVWYLTALYEHSGGPAFFSMGTPCDRDSSDFSSFPGHFKAGRWWIHTSLCIASGLDTAAYIERASIRWSS